MYPNDWHRVFGDKTGESARRILPGLLKRFDVQSLVEIGCGNAHWTQVAIDEGVGDYCVVDGKWNNRNDLLVDPARFMEADLSQPLALAGRYDMAVCLEVAEHVPESSAEVLVQSLANAADVILFSAAIPLQGGHGHINEQWPSYWCDLFAGAAYRVFDIVRPLHWHDRAIHYWYRQNCFVFVELNNRAAIRAAEEAADKSGNFPLDAVHPEKFEEVASYRAVALKRLAPQLPRILLQKLKYRLRDKV